MHIICPHCTTSYAIELSTLGVAGRTVRCSRCKNVWLARREDAVSTYALAPSMAEAGEPSPHAAIPANWNDPAANPVEPHHQTPVVESPSISAQWPIEDNAGPEPALPPPARHEETKAPRRPRRSLLRGLKASLAFRLPAISPATA